MESKVSPDNTNRETLRKNFYKAHLHFLLTRIPAIVDHSRGDFNVFESGAIMLYLCEHYDPEGKLLPKDPNLRSETIQWVRTPKCRLHCVRES